MGPVAVRGVLGALLLAVASCGYESTAGRSDGGVGDLPNTWSIDDDEFGSSQAFLVCRDAQAFDGDRDSVLALTLVPGWLVGEAGSLTVSSAPLLAEGEIAVSISHGSARWIAQSGLVSWRAAAPDETWPVAVEFADLPALDLEDTPARLSGSLEFGFSSCE